MACAGVLAETAIALAVLPMGTGNLVARNFGIPLRPVRVRSRRSEGKDRKIDVGVLGEQRFVIMAGSASTPRCSRTPRKP